MFQSSRMDFGGGGKKGIREIWQRRRRRCRRRRRRRRPPAWLARAEFRLQPQSPPRRAAPPAARPPDPGLHYTRHDRETRSRSSRAAASDSGEVARSEVSESRNYLCRIGCPEEEGE